MAQMTDNAGQTLTSKGRFYQIVNATTYTSNTARRVCKILVTLGTGTISVYDATTATGTPIWTKTAVAVGDIYEIDCPLTTALTVVVGATTTATVIYG